MPLQDHIEFVRCNLCDADDTTLVFHLPVREHQIGKYARDVWALVRCRQCGLIYVNPRPDAESLGRLYDFDDAVDRHFVQDWFIDSADLSRATWQRYLRAARRYCSAGRLLDVGCGAGSFLVEARRLGYDVAGQEVSPYFIRYGREQHGLTVYQGELEALNLEPASFDCVTAFDVIEHHPDPQRLLRQMRELVKPGGLAVVSTHDIGNWFARLYGPRWRQLSPIGHLTYFTRPTLSKMMAARGFQVMHIGGLHTIDGNNLAECRNWVTQLFRVVALRAVILMLYKPVAERVPLLTRWRLQWGNATLDHRKLMVRVGQQVIMDDDMVMLARAV